MKKYMLKEVKSRTFTEEEIRELAIQLNDDEGFDLDENHYLNFSVFAEAVLKDYAGTDSFQEFDGWYSVEEVKS